MPRTLTATLVADGTSDFGALLPLISLLLDEISPVPYRLLPADGLRNGHELEVRLPQAVKAFPCELLFVHRDAEGQTRRQREEEIERALMRTEVVVPHVCVIPVRMTEAWLLVDEIAIRTAVGNPSGQAPLGLPLPNQVESVHAKERLFRALDAASELGAHRRRRFQPQLYRHRVAEGMTGLDLLRSLPSFRHFESSLRARLTVET